MPLTVFYCFAAWSVASWCRWYYGSLSPVSQTSQLSSGLCTRSETARQWKVRWKELWIRLSGVYFSQRKSAMCASAQTGFWGEQLIYESNLSFSSFVFVLGSVQGYKLKIVLWWRSRLWIAPVWPIRLPTESKSLLGLNIFLYFALLTLIRQYFPRFVPDASLCAPNSSLIACFPALQTGCTQPAQEFSPMFYVALTTTIHIFYRCFFRQKNRNEEVLSRMP